MRTLKPEDFAFPGHPPIPGTRVLQDLKLTADECEIVVNDSGTLEVKPHDANKCGIFAAANCWLEAVKQ